ncbi:MAG: hypothetical protein L0207_07050 [Chlamydiae bacterium]|nr:hypothetical protein [Chlamydiota bacterium]
MSHNYLLISCCPIFGTIQEGWLLYEILKEMKTNPIDIIQKQNKMFHLQHAYQKLGSSVGICVQATAAITLLYFASLPFSETTEEKEVRITNPNRYYYARLTGMIFGFSCMISSLFHQLIRIKLTYNVYF